MIYTYVTSEPRNIHKLHNIYQCNTDGNNFIEHNAYYCIVEFCAVFTFDSMICVGVCKRIATLGQTSTLRVFVSRLVLMFLPLSVASCSQNGQ